MALILEASDKVEDYAVKAGDTLESIAIAKCPALGWKVLARYNWGTDSIPEVRRGLYETIGADLADLLDQSLNATPEKIKLKPYPGLSPKLKIPAPWKLDPAAVLKTHTIEVKRKRPATAVGISKLPYFFDPTNDDCPVKCLYEGDAARADKRGFEVHATGYHRVEKKVLPGGTAYREIPCGTFSKNDLTQTYIVRNTTAAAPGKETVNWDGASLATVGILTKPEKIKSRCAPYNVLIRYYKDDSDKQVRLKLDPFYPRWRLTARATHTLEEDSLIVKWTIEGQASSKAKLKIGNLSVWDEDGLIFIAPLTEDQIAAGSYDLLKGPVKLDKAEIERSRLPYRIQIHAHSDMEEDNGLALAVMPTQVPPYYYEQVQFIGFNIKNDTAGVDYKGADDPEDDIKKRCNVMIDAIISAYNSADTSVDSNVLKVFVAPEFYFRGTDGAYPVEEISTIVPRLRKETDDASYVDWLFVFGTAIGSLKHELNSAKIKHCEKKLPVRIDAILDPTTIRAKLWTAPRKGWVIEQGAVKRTVVSAQKLIEYKADTSALWKIELGSSAGLLAGDAKMFETIVDVQPGAPWARIKVNSPAFSRIAVQKVTNDAILIGGWWEVLSGGVTGQIGRVAPEPDGSYWVSVYMGGGGNFQVGEPFELREPITTEIINVALVQKGWHAPLLGDGSLRQVVTYKEFISPIDFLRDENLNFHESLGTNRKVRLYKANDQPVLPTAGATDIGGGSPNVTRQPGSAAGSEINLTGQGGGCVFDIDHVTFGLEVCLDHGNNRLFDFYNSATSNKQAGDPKVQVQLIPSYGMSIGEADAGKEVAVLTDGLVFNVDGSRMESVARTWDQTYSCNTHWSKSGVAGDKCDHDSYYIDSGELVYRCWDASHVPPPGLTYGPCAHGTWNCDEDLQSLGTGFGPTDTIQVALSNNPTYFNREGNVQVFPPQDLPDPDIV